MCFYMYSPYVTITHKKIQNIFIAPESSLYTHTHTHTHKPTLRQTLFGTSITID